MASEEFWLDQFEKRGNYPETWLMEQAASTKSTGVELDDPAVYFDTPALLLGAAAIEALLKGRVVPADA